MDNGGNARSEFPGVGIDPFDYRQPAKKGHLAFGVSSSIELYLFRDGCQPRAGGYGRGFRHSRGGVLGYEELTVADGAHAGLCGGMALRAQCLDLFRKSSGEHRVDPRAYPLRQLSGRRSDAENEEAAVVTRLGGRIEIRHRPSSQPNYLHGSRKPI